MDKDGQIKIWEKALDEAFALTERETSPAFAEAELLGALDRVKTRLSQDIKIFESHREVFTRPCDCEKAGPTGELLAKAFTDWREQGGPSIPALLLIGAEILGIPVDQPAFKAALLTGLAAETGHDNPYHDRNHFREVVSMTIRHCFVHNQLAKKDDLFDTQAISEILLAAAGHDLMHDGSQGNIIDGVYTPYRLEAKAIAAIEPFMRAAGMTESGMESVRLMIRVTDITEFESRKSPRQHLRDAVAFHKGETGKPEDLPPELSALRESRMEAMKASVMSDSDLGASISTYEFCKEQSRRLSQEKPVVTDSPGCIAYFAKRQIESFLSPAGLKTCSDSLGKLLETAEYLIEQVTQKLPGFRK